MASFRASLSISSIKQPPFVPYNNISTMPRTNFISKKGYNFSQNGYLTIVSKQNVNLSEKGKLKVLKGLSLSYSYTKFQTLADFINWFYRTRIFVSDMQNL